MNDLHRKQAGQSFISHFNPDVVAWIDFEEPIFASNFGDTLTKQEDVNEKENRNQYEHFANKVCIQQQKSKITMSSSQAAGISMAFARYFATLMKDYRNSSFYKSRSRCQSREEMEDVSMQQVTNVQLCEESFENHICQSNCDKDDFCARVSEEQTVESVFDVEKFIDSQNDGSKV